MEIGSKIRVKPFKVWDIFKGKKTTEYAGRVGTVLQIGDSEKGSLAVKVELDGDSDFYYWFMMSSLEEITVTAKKNK